MARGTVSRRARPLDIRSLKQSIASREIVLPSSLVEIGRFALAHPDTIAFSSGRQLAEAVGASPTSVHRLACAFGFRGYSDLRTFCQEHLRQRASSGVLSVPFDRMRADTTDFVADA